MKKIAISMLVLGSAAAFAGNVPPSPGGERTRAEVQAEYIRAQKDGTLANLTDAAPLQPPTALVTHRTRADVTAEYIRARNEGTLVIVGDAAPLQPQVAQAPSRDREAVKAEALQASRAYIRYDM